MSKISPFDFIKSINEKRYLMVDEHIEKQYLPFIVNRGLSQFVECVPFVHMMNLYPELSNRMQYDYLYHSIRKGKRFGKWAKEDKYESLEEVMQYYKVSKPKALQIIDRLTNEQVNSIVKLLNSTGGRL